METRLLQAIRPGVGVLAVVATIAFAGVGSGLAGSASDTTFSDPVGDSAGGPDVTSIAIHGDEATGQMTFTLNVDGFAMIGSPDGLERGAYVWLDTDRNSATGDPQDGTEYAFMAWSDADGNHWNVSKWNGSTFEWVPPPHPSIFFSRSGGLMSWSVNKTDLGGSTSMRLYVVAGTWNASGTRLTVDDAPDAGWWTYDLAPPPPPPAPKVYLRIDPPTATPKLAVAGKRLTVTFPVYFEKHETASVIDLDDPSGSSTQELVIMTPVATGRLVCDPSFSGKVITHAESFTDGAARLSFLIPKAAKGKQLKVKIRITATEPGSGKTLTSARVTAFRVR